MLRRISALFAALALVSMGSLIGAPAPAAASHFTDIEDSIFENDILWLEDQEITGGCTPTEFCPDEPVTRGQMAAFLSRALDLTEQADDPFTDDDDSVFENDIERLYAAGITGGCTATQFCPDDLITRGQMAAFLTRAFDLTEEADDPFTDDDDSIFETSIERIYAAGITAGCTATLFCPENPVTRGQMAAFLHRAAPYFTTGQNAAPELAPVADQSSVEGESVSLQLEATDANGDDLFWSATGLPDGLTIDADTGLISGTIADGAAASSPYDAEVTVDDGEAGDTASFTWTVTEPASEDASAHLEITASGGIDASTFSTSAFTLSNDSESGVTIESIAIDLSTAVLPDMVFDPNGTAGDASGKCLTADSGASGTGFEAPADPCTDPFSQPHTADPADGYEVLTLTFTDFDPGETFTFSVDVDPTSIQGATTTGGSGSVSGLELSGSSVATTFSDGTIATETWLLDGSDSGSEATFEAGLPAAPQVGVSGITLESTTLSDRHEVATVDAATQTITISGTPDTEVSVMHLDVGLSADPGNDVEEYEANLVEAVSAQTVILDGSGTGSVEVTLVEGLNYIAAAQLTDGGVAGEMSNVVVLDYQPGGGGVEGVIYRVNAGGPAITGDPIDWSEDQAASSADAGGTAVAGTPSPYVNWEDAGAQTYGQDVSITLDSSVPAGTPEELFSVERWDPDTGAEMVWSFPVDPGSYEVRLYFAEIFSGTMSEGARVFDVSIEGDLVLDDYDIYADVGGNTGVMKSFVVTSDDTLTITFGHVTENPNIKGIEVLATDVAGTLAASPSSVDFGSAEVGTTVTETVTLTNLGVSGDPEITIDSVSAGGDFAATLTGSAAVAPGDATTVDVSFSPGSVGTHSDELTVEHSGTNSPLTVPLSGEGFEPGAAPVSFTPDELGGTGLDNPTTLQLGPDDRLYVGQQNGQVHAFTVVRNGPADYSVTDTETITLVQEITNHDDDGTVNSSVTDRQVTGLLVTGTAEAPVLYVTSSDPRIGAGGSGTDLGLDTNSGVISRLTWNGSSWDKVDLVRGLPRSEENHSTNGMALDTSTNTLYVAQGGHTNAGAPANNFALLPEYALSAAILSVDLDAIGDATYDLPTLDASSPNEPFGGMDGLNQAILVDGGPVQVHSPGYRNPYDVVLTADGQLYTVDNGANAGWGDVPVNEGPDGDCTNEVNGGGPTTSDNLHLISSAGYYGGHPNPTRGNTANTFDGQSPVETGSNPIECDFQSPGSADGALELFSSSTNGLTEYTATNFGGAMAGDLLTASFSDTVWRLQLNGAGDAVTSKESLFSGFASTPLDVTAQGDDDVFPGTVWVANYGSDSITVFEPDDFDGGGGDECTGADDSALDEDGDGYTNADEIDNGTDPCSAASTPPDYDGDDVSNLNDPDDDNDGLDDTVDPFAVDPDNGTTTSIPVTYGFSPDSVADSLLGLGFTGLMMNGTDYLELYDPDNLTAGGAAGVLTVDSVPPGDAHATTNTQQYGFQFGVDAASASEPFTVHTQVLSPFGGETPSNFQSVGLFIGNGDQDNYLKLVVSANGGTGGVQFAKETGGSFSSVAQPDDGSVIGASSVDLYLVVDPTAAEPTVEAFYSVDGGTLVPAGSTTIPAEWVEATDGTALAVGVISTSNGADPFTASWNLIEVTSGAVGGGGGEATHLRVNAGGSSISSSDGPDWLADTGGSPSEYVNAAASGSQTFSTTDAITLDSSVPSGTPMELFQAERYDPDGSGTGDDPEMVWSFPVEAGTTYEVRLYLAEIFLTAENNDTSGPRVFDVSIEDTLVIDDLNLFEEYGHDVGIMESFTVTPGDDTLTVTFIHQQENPAVKAIEIIEQ